MSKLGRDYHRRKLEKLLGHCTDEATITAIANVTAVFAGHSAALRTFQDLPSEAVGAEIGTQYYIAPWTLETLVNELLCAPKHRLLGGREYRELRPDFYSSLRSLTSRIISLENAEDGIFLEKYDVFTEMHRIGQRQFGWQRGMANAPVLFRSLHLYGAGSAGRHFEHTTGLAIDKFVKVGVWLAGALSNRNVASRNTDLSRLGITSEERDLALNRMTIRHAEARAYARNIRAEYLHTAYKRSVLRDYPVIAFGEHSDRLRAPLPLLITHRWTSGLYLDVVSGGSAVWTDIGSRFERYCIEYLAAMLSPYAVSGERPYGPKKTNLKTPDVLVSEDDEVVLVAECKAKRMTFEARFADDPVADAATGYSEIAKGIFQIWRFFSHARRGIAGVPNVRPDCLGILLTLDSWLSMARNQEEQVIAAAHALADKAGGITPEDRRHVSVCYIDDVEFALQNGSGETFLAAVRDLMSEKKRGWTISVAHASEQVEARPYPFKDRIAEVLPWWTTGADD